MGNSSYSEQWQRVAYALIVQADMYYLLTFNRTDQNCMDLSADERARFDAAVGGRCYGDLRDLIGFLRYLRRKFQNPTYRIRGC